MLSRNKIILGKKNKTNMLSKINVVKYVTFLNKSLLTDLRSYAWVRWWDSFFLVSDPMVQKYFFPPVSQNNSTSFAVYCVQVYPIVYNKDQNMVSRKNSYVIEYKWDNYINIT